MAQEFQQPDPGTLRAQRMTADESRAVIDLWQQERVEQTGLTDRPAVPDVAEGLDITVEDVQRLLQDVRARRVEEEHALAVEQELSEIRLAEEERKLAEVRRQRAELRREQAEAGSLGSSGWKPRLPVPSLKRRPADKILPSFLWITAMIALAVGIAFGLAIIFPDWKLAN